MEQESYQNYRKKTSNLLKTKSIQNQEPLQGYEPTTKEKREKKEPVETMRLVNGDGMISVGINRTKEITMTMVSDSGGEVLRTTKNKVRMDSSTKTLGQENKIYVNSHKKAESGLAIKSNTSNYPVRMVDEIKKAAKEDAFDVVNEIAPFFSLEKEQTQKDEMTDLIRQAKTEDKEWIKELEEQRHLLYQAISQKEADLLKFTHDLANRENYLEGEAKECELNYLAQNNVANTDSMEKDTEDESEESSKNKTKKF